MIKPNAKEIKLNKEHTKLKRWQDSTPKTTNLQTISPHHSRSG